MLRSLTLAPEAAARLSRRLRRVDRLWLTPLLVAALLLLAQLLFLDARRPTMLLDMTADARLAPLLVRGFHEPERDGVRQFRWTSGEAMARFGQPVVGTATLIGLRLGAAPPSRPAPDLQLWANERPVASLDIDDHPRVYLLLMPLSLPAGDLLLALRSDAAPVPPDPRPLGVRVEQIWLDALGPARPALRTLLLQTLLLVLLALLLRRTDIGPAPTAALLLAVGAGLWLAWGLAPLVAAEYLARLTAAAAVLAALTFWLLPHLEQHAAALAPPATLRRLWVIALLACTVRLVGTLYPPFAAYDLGRNLGRLEGAFAGNLVATSMSFEFAGGVTLYPAGPYLVLGPGVLVGLSGKMALQAGIALVDGFSALWIGLLALLLGLPRRSALLAALAYAALPVALTSLYFGHTAQVFGQALMTPLALALLTGMRRDATWPWWLAAALLAFALFSHIGVAILAAAWLALAWVPLGLTLPRRQWRDYTIVVAVSGLTAALLLYGPWLGLKLRELDAVGRDVLRHDDGPAYILIARAWQMSFYEEGWLPALVGLLLLGWGSLPRGATALLSTWLGAALLFWIVEMLTGLQVRYLVFLAPLACLGIGQVLDRATRRGPHLAALGMAALLLLLAQAAIPWYLGAFADVQMSMVPLLR